MKCVQMCEKMRGARVFCSQETRHVPSKGARLSCQSRVQSRRGGTMAPRYRNVEAAYVRNQMAQTQRRQDHRPPHWRSTVKVAHSPLGRKCDPRVAVATHDLS